jgi:hypothetical protein
MSKATTPDYAARHRRFGWWSLLVFVTFGLVLETLHGFKLDAYLNLSNETRRLLWTLAHAHGTALAIVNILFGLGLERAGVPRLRQIGVISTSLIAASLLLPGGFFLGGVTYYEGDPGLGILLVPPGAVLLIAALFLIARGAAVTRGDDSSPRGG